MSFLQSICKFLCPTKPASEPTKPETLLSYKEIVSMLTAYDKTRPESHQKMFGFEDTRVSTFNFTEVKNYLAYAEKLAEEKGIQLTSISFVKGAYTQQTTKEKSYINYENLMYLPKAMVNGEEVLVDLLNSTSERIVTFKEMLVKHGYKWRYDNAKNFSVNTGIKTSIKSEKQEIQSVQKSMLSEDDESFVANFSHISPPH